MTHDKARELFSAYSEGTLDAGLTKALEQKLDSDPHLAKEYAMFDATLNSLVVLRSVEVPVPADLGERISARLDKHIWESKQKPVTIWQGWAKGLGFAGLAAVVVLGTLLSLSHRGTGTIGSNMTGLDSGAGDHVALVKTDSGIHLHFSPSSAKTLSVYSEPDNKLVTVLKVNGTVDAPLTNPNPTVGILRIDVDGKESVLVALPGTNHDENARHAARTSKPKTTLRDLAGAIATFYSVPVELQVADPEASAAWNFKELDARTAATKALDPQTYSVDQRDNGFICIQSN